MINASSEIKELIIELLSLGEGRYGGKSGEGRYGRKSGGGFWVKGIVCWFDEKCMGEGKDVYGK